MDYHNFGYVRMKCPSPLSPSVKKLLLIANKGHFLDPHLPLENSIFKTNL